MSGLPLWSCLTHQSRKYSFCMSCQDTSALRYLALPFIVWWSEEHAWVFGNQAGHPPPRLQVARLNPLRLLLHDFLEVPTTERMPQTAQLEMSLSHGRPHCPWEMLGASISVTKAAESRVALRYAKSWGPDVVFHRCVCSGVV